MNTSFCIQDFLISGSIVSLSYNCLLIGWGKPYFRSFSELDHSQPAFYFSDFFLENTQPWIQYTHWLELSIEDFKSLLEPIDQIFKYEWTISHSEQFKQAFNELGDLLQKGLLQKGVPYLFAYSSQHMTESRLKSCLIHGLNALKEKKGYLYGHWHLSLGVLGITPELLFTHYQKESHKIHTMALAGTCDSSQDLELFLKDEKEQHEHQFVVQGICQAVQSLGNVHIGEVQLLKLPVLTHLITAINVDLENTFDFDQLVQCLHPTPALGAYPKNKGKMWIKNFQKHTPRYYYGAPIGFQHFQKGIAQCFVGIRNVQWNKKGMQIGAGCGVVKQSVFEKEYQEIQLKLEAICNQFNL